MSKKKAVIPGTRDREANGNWKTDRLYRLEAPQTVEDIDKWDHLDAEEKVFAKRALEQWTNTGADAKPEDEWGTDAIDDPLLNRLLWGSSLNTGIHDPTSYTAFFSFFEQVVVMTTGLDSTSEMMAATSHSNGFDFTEKRNNPEVRERYHLGRLMATALALERKDDFTLRVMTRTPGTESENGVYSMPPDKVAMLHNPFSSVWRDEESLALQFLYGVIRYEMTDEIWEAAVATWGEKQTLRYIQWINVYDSIYRTQRTLWRQRYW